MSAIFFQAVGKPFRSVTASLVRDIVCFIPLILIYPIAFGGVEGILYAAPSADFLAIIVTVGLTVSFLKSLKEEPAEVV